MKILSLLTVGMIALTGVIPLSLPVRADDTIRVDAKFARERVLKVKVTPMGLVVDFKSGISSVNITHKRHFVFSGMDGMLCQATANCPEGSRAPSQLLLRKINPIDFETESATANGVAMLYVTTVSGRLYRLELQPASGTPPYTKVEMESENLSPSLSGI